MAQLLINTLGPARIFLGTSRGVATRKKNRGIIQICETVKRVSMLASGSQPPASCMCHKFFRVIVFFLLCHTQTDWVKYEGSTLPKKTVWPMQLEKVLKFYCRLLVRYFFSGTPVKLISWPHLKFFINHLQINIDHIILFQITDVIWWYQFLVQFSKCI